MPESSNASAKSLSRLSMVIAVLSLGSSFFQSWNYARNLDTVQRNILRVENLRTCKEMIDVFFQLRLRMEQAAERARDGTPMDTIEIRAFVYKFGALGTYLANFRDETVRQRYAALAWDLLGLTDKLAQLSAEEFKATFDRIDAQFATVNEDCTQAAQRMTL